MPKEIVFTTKKKPTTQVLLETHHFICRYSLEVIDKLHTLKHLKRNAIYT